MSYAFREKSFHSCVAACCCFMIYPLFLSANTATSKKDNSNVLRSRLWIFPVLKILQKHIMVILYPKILLQFVDQLIINNVVIRFLGFLVMRVSIKGFVV